jgi:hypothetical protein
MKLNYWLIVAILLLILLLILNYNIKEGITLDDFSSRMNVGLIHEKNKIMNENNKEKINNDNMNETKKLVDEQERLQKKLQDLKRQVDKWN